MFGILLLIRVTINLIFLKKFGFVSHANIYFLYIIEIILEMFFVLNAGLYYRNSNVYCIFLLLFSTRIVAQFQADKECFCKVEETVDSCICSNYSVDVFNNEKIFPALKNILQRDFFKFYKVFKIFLLKQLIYFFYFIKI